MLKIFLGDGKLQQISASLLKTINGSLGESVRKVEQWYNKLAETSYTRRAIEKIKPSISWAVFCIHDKISEVHSWSSHERGASTLKSENIPGPSNEEWLRQEAQIANLKL